MLVTIGNSSGCPSLHYIVRTRTDSVADIIASAAVVVTAGS